MLPTVLGLTLLVSLGASPASPQKSKHTRAKLKAAQRDAKERRFIEKIVEAAKCDVVPETATAPTVAAPVVEAPVPQPVPEPAPIVAAPLELHVSTQPIWKPSPAAWIFAGVGLAGLGGGALTTYWGRKDNEALAACSPWCSTGAVNHVRNMYIAADVAIGLGAAAAIASIWFFARSPVALTLVPTQAGASASLQGRF